jgi:tRNA A37 threonylcarbamoyladenosine biosynthesis protein TsaE
MPLLFESRRMSTMPKRIDSELKARALMVVEGAAGAGKTTTRQAAEATVAAAGRRMLVVTPTSKAGQVAARDLGPAARRRRGGR